MVATLVGLLTVILTIWIWRKEQRRWVRVLSLLALLSVVLQGVLGGLTVLFLLPTGVSVAHATLAQTFFCIVASIALFTSPWWLRDQELSPERGGRPSTLALCAAMTLTLYMQLALGALMRHTDSGLAVPDFPLAYGQLFPSLSPESIAAYNERLIHLDLRLASEGSITSSQILVHMIHRLWALVVAGLVIWTSLRLRKHSTSAAKLSSFSFILILLLLVQISLGAWTVFSAKAVAVTTAHVATGALLLVSSVLATHHVARLSRLAALRHVYVVNNREAIA
jgi:heme A synthase